MADLKGLETHRNLKDAFSAEAANVHRYLYFSKIAEIEGFQEVAQLFRDVAEGGICSAHGMLDFLKRVGDPATDLPVGETERNLAAALASEVFEYSEVYPAMAEMAYRDGFPDIASWFETLTKLKRSHVARFNDALAQSMNGGSSGSSK